MNENLLTVKDVAKFLQISSRTVYDNSRKLGGFYPFGISVLRFKPEVIYGNPKGQGTQILGVPVSISGEELRRQGLLNPTRGRKRKDRAPERNKGIIKTDPSRRWLEMPQKETEQLKQLFSS